MRKLLSVARFEFVTMAATKGFVISTIVGPILIAAIAVLPGLIAGNIGEEIPEDARLGIAAADRGLVEELSRQLTEAGIAAVESGPEAELERMVRRELLDGYVTISGDPERVSSFSYVSRSGTDTAVAGLVEQSVGDLVVQRRLERSGLDAQRVQQLTARPEMQMRRLAEEGGTVEQSVLGVMFTVMGFVLLIYMTILLYGQMIGRSALQEKSSKTVEIMLSSVRPFHLMFGKILGKGLAGLLQYLLWISIALLLSRVVAPQMGADLPAALNAGNLGWLLLFFLLAYFLFAAGYAALGAAADDEQHLGQLGAPFIMMLIVPLILISLIVSAPNSTPVVVLSLFPFTAPVVMLARIIVDTPPLWQILASIGILVASVAAMATLSAKLFRVAILMTGQRFKLGQVLKLVRVK